MRRQLRTRAVSNRCRRNNHKQYLKDCPEYLRGAGGTRSHHRRARPGGGELSIDISGPFPEGITPTNRPVIEADRPQYILVGAFAPFPHETALKRWERRTRELHTRGYEGPILYEERGSDAKTVVHYVEMLRSRRIEDTLSAILRIISKIEGKHKAKTVYRLHGDRAQELTGKLVQEKMAEIGIVVTSTAGCDPKANGRAKKAMRWLEEKTRTLLAREIKK